MLGNLVATNEDGFLLNVVVQPINVDKPAREDRRRDVNEFFENPVERLVEGKKKSYCMCKLCP
jgi:hypothetical protein